MSTLTEAPGGEVLLYEAPDGQVRVDVRLDHETVWLTQEQMGQLFGRERSVITKHVHSVFREGELAPEATCAKFAHTAGDGKSYQVNPQALTALALLIAESAPTSKDLMIRLIINLLAEPWA
jgi:hypothetical protein